MSVEKKRIFENGGDHADEMETSLMLFLSPDLVLPLDKAGDGDFKKFRIKAFNEDWAWAERRWSKVTADTGIGNPKLASKGKGVKYFRAITDKISKLLIELTNANLDDMYK
jgi:creatinine amidohydrolase